MNEIQKLQADQKEQYKKDKEYYSDATIPTTKSSSESKITQEKLLKLFKSKNNRLVFLSDSRHQYRWFWKTGISIGKTYEVRELLKQDDRKRALKKIMDSISSTRYSTNAIRNLHDYINISSDMFNKDEVKYIAEKSNSNVIYTYKITPDIKSKDTKSLIPAWNEWLNRLSDPEAFSAWIWSIYESKHRGRQLMYVWGEGEDGKSTVDRVIQRKFGINYCMSVTDTSIFAGSNKHGTSGLVGKRFISLPDITNDRLLKYPKLKAILGGDAITIEPKGMPLFSTPIDARIMAGANDTLDLSNKVWELSRLLLIEVSTRANKRTVDWEDNLSKEYDLFIQYAKWCYEKVCPKHYEILSVRSDESKKILGSASLEETFTILESVFEFADYKNNSDMYVTRSEFVRILKEKRVCGNNREIKDMKKFLYDNGYEDFKSPNAYKKMINGRQQRIYRGLRINV